MGIRERLERPILSHFTFEGDVLSVEPYGDGHINETFLVRTTQRRYILQRMNEEVFPDPAALMHNIQYVTEYLRAQGQETLQIVATVNGEPYLRSSMGNFRMYVFIENTVSYNLVDNPQMFENAARAFGRFQNLLSGFDARKLVEVIPHFHDTPARLSALERAVENDVSGRARGVGAEIEFFESRKLDYTKVVDALARGDVPLRVTHNDTKLNNILMDARTGEARAIIDLDTIMPGSLLYDFGDAVRFGASTALEDERDLEKVHFSLDYFRAYTVGFVGEVANSLTPTEAELLPFSALLMAEECGMRFLTDYLDGDEYFATAYDDHNLVRAHTQMRLVEDMEAQMTEMKVLTRQIVNRYQHATTNHENDHEES
ncbi:MAG: aminoglycoside phosphotransferase family protein [Actinomycetaceae bacterium]|nr:aminoglycoside phosphotransferase family protein [Actinomycetaceae bacterium]